ncbi:MAG: DUF5615 family PIN-like protein [Bacteroidetes bacterium]|nr:DUF5615 family PIN-like protein [Bacteroidota bacterium]
MTQLNFLADENFPKSSIVFLRNKGHKVKSIKEEFPGTDDERVLSIASIEKLILLTFDRDYSDLIYKNKLNLPSSLIFFRMNLTNQEGDLPAKILMNLIKEEKIDLSNKFIVIQPNKIRIKPLQE